MRSKNLAGIQYAFSGKALMRNQCTGEESVAIVMHMQYMQRMSSWRFSCQYRQTLKLKKDWARGMIAALFPQ